MDPLPADLLAALAELRHLASVAKEHVKRGRAHYLALGKAWAPIRVHPATLKVGLDALRQFLPHHPRFLNRCHVAYDGHATGDLEKGERWIEATRYLIRNVDEPYRMAEIIDAYRNRLKPRPRQRGRLPWALTTGRPGCCTDTATFRDGRAVLGAALPLLTEMADESVDFVYDDPPYGIWGKHAHGFYGKILHEWDKPLNWDALWPELWRVSAPRGTIAISAAEPLASMLIASQLENYLYTWYWRRRRATTIFNPKYGRPMNVIEPVAVFSQVGHKERTYNPQMRPLDEPDTRLRGQMPQLLREPRLAEFVENMAHLGTRFEYRARYPINLIEVPPSPYDRHEGRPFQHGQKPVELVRYLLRTHTNPGNLVLDFTAGSMTTAVAAVLEGRRFLVFEQEPKHFAIGVQRLTQLYAQVRGAA